MKKGFTLAEVLITLGIIGIVAALTIPTLMANYQKQVYVASLHKAYAVWNIALQQMANDGGCPGDLSCFFDSGDMNTMGDKISNYFHVAQKCPAGSLFSRTYSCFPWTFASNFDGTSNTNGYGGNTQYSFVTTDGMSVDFSLDPYQGCVVNYAAGNSSKTCMNMVYIDTNGLKKPNTQGRDIFLFRITTGKAPMLYPFGGPEIWYWKNGYCGKTAGTTDGGECAGRIIDEDWTMNY